MQEDVRALLILQDRDRRLLALGRDLDKLPQDEARARAKLDADETAVALADKRLVESELRVKKIELDAETRRMTIKRLKNQQFETRKNEEFVALGHEITRYEGELDQLETAELEAMEDTDRLRGVLGDSEATRARTRRLIDEDLAAIAQRRERMRTERDEVLKQHAAALANVPEDIVPLYQRLMKTKDGLAIAEMRDGRCEGCHMKLIASTTIAVQSAKEITRCENCGRILHAAD